MGRWDEMGWGGGHTHDRRRGYLALHDSIPADSDLARKPPLLRGRHDSHAVRHPDHFREGRVEIVAIIVSPSRK